MLATALDAKAKLEVEGLHVALNDPDSLWIAATVRDSGPGIKLSDDACSLMCDAGRWVVVFPAEGLLTYEVPGSLPELVAIITSVYAHYRQAGGPFKDALKHVLGDPHQYLLGGSLARA